MFFGTQCIGESAQGCPVSALQIAEI